MREEHREALARIQEQYQEEVLPVGRWAGLPVSAACPCCTLESPVPHRGVSLSPVRAGAQAEVRAAGGAAERGHTAAAAP